MPDALPPYLVIANDLRAKIQTGAPGYLPGERIPSTSEIRVAYAATSTTVRLAQERLKREGLIVARSTAGYYVRRQPPVRFLSLDRFTRAAREEGNGAYDVELRRMGYVGRTQWLRLERDVASDADGIGGQASTAELLGVDPGTPVMVRSRHMFAAPLDAEGRADYRFEEVTQIATSFIPWDLAEQHPGLTQEDSGRGGILSRLEDIGHQVVRHPAVAWVRLGTDEEWDLLKMEPPADVLTIDRQGFDVRGRVVEACRHIAPPRMVKMAIEYRMDRPAGGNLRALS